ncbi:MAG TPA: glycosyltransferase [Sphingobium sp.]|nr:glycosyltransferase [Sphingobium sp.]
MTASSHVAADARHPPKDLASRAWTKEAEPQAGGRSGGAQMLEPSLERQRKQIKQLLDGARTSALARKALPEARGVAMGFPRDHISQSYLLQMQERAGDSKGLSEAWEALFRAYPNDRTVLLFHMRRLVRDKQQDRARALLEKIIPSPVMEDADLLAKAELLDVIRAFDASDAAFRELLARSDQREARVSWAKRLWKRGLVEDAGLILEPVMEELSHLGKMAEQVAEIQELRRLFRYYENVEDLAGVDFRILAMKHAVLAHVDRMTAEDDGEPLRLVMVTGGLGAGGAERQLSRLAALLQGRAADPSQGIGRVDVLVKEHDPARGGDFFLPDLLKAGVPVGQINDLPPVAAHKQRALDPDFALLLKMLPPQVHYGVVRMAPWLREARPHVVSLWQDGGCLYGALAALFAGVPLIQLVFRGLPPNIRANRHKPEYEVLFKALARVPGVEFMTNSHAAAREYAQWLDLPEARFTVLWNAVPALDSAGRPEDRATWDKFVSRTPGATETIGGVFRFEPDKRPLVWLRMAARYLRRRPTARFVIVGSGQKLEEARELVRKLRITRRILFAGTTSAVGYWYDKMDVKVLLSRFEGLPNVLIEAQQLGTPVVSTPAGGAQECLVEGVTGHILDSAIQPDLDQACDRIAALVDRRRTSDGALEQAARAMASQFNVDMILDRFIDTCRAVRVQEEAVIASCAR